MQAYSLDLRERVVRAYEKGGSTLAEIAVQFSVGQTFVKKMLRQKREPGSLGRLPQRAGAKKKLADSQRKWLAQQVKVVPDITLGELQEQLGEEESIQVSQATLCRELQALRLLRKKSR
ncbi:MAG: IS630 transposase-related protein [Candidatus Binatia bacterium]